MEKDLDVILDKIWVQARKDRDCAIESYEDLRSKMDTLQDYAINGQNLAKFLELMGKTTSQLVDLYKVVNKKEDNRVENINFSDEELDKIYEETQKPEQKKKKRGRPKKNESSK